MLNGPLVGCCRLQGVAKPTASLVCRSRGGHEGNNGRSEIVVRETHKRLGVMRLGWWLGGELNSRPRAYESKRVVFRTMRFYWQIR
jgi:hypothetical protein